MLPKYGSGPDKPAGRQGRVGPREEGRKSVFVCLHRNGAEGETSAAKKKQIRYIVEKLSGIFVKTERSDRVKGGWVDDRESELNARESVKTPYLWQDWYRIPVKPGKTVDDMARMLHAEQIFDGPYWGMGRECMAAGQGTAEQTRAIRVRKQSEQRRHAEGTQKGFNLPILMNRLFGDCSVARLDKFPRAESVWDSFTDEQNWLEAGFKRSDWFWIVERQPAFQQVWAAVSAIVDSDHIQRAVPTLHAWIREVLEGMPTPVGLLISALRSEANRTEGFGKEAVRFAIANSSVSCAGTIHKLQAKVEYLRSLVERMEEEENAK